MPSPGLLRAVRRVWDPELLPSLTLPAAHSEVTSVEHAAYRGKGWSRLLSAEPAGINEDDREGAALSEMSGTLWKGVHGCWLLCVQSAAYEEPVKFPTKAGSWQTVRNSGVRFLSALHASAQTTGGGGEVDGVHTRGEVARGTMEKPHRTHLTSYTVHRTLA
ncbi:unnamed protein product [Rangifer tarandus platyrhynchus]|uniref:Uncharacterized protein n=2 Tax=Rangifer tarandus platyrhynchus TaxID=3082113 RepID=A0ABN8YFF1_RANTA|nr:unnamed protein product [Rangifer tarandus platyrhynchus]CAI9700170.1 unnamed protein product [Rangifer tarandus platyrhynchus]